MKGALIGKRSRRACRIYCRRFSQTARWSYLLIQLCLVRRLWPMVGDLDPVQYLGRSDPNSRFFLSTRHSMMRSTSQCQVFICQQCLAPRPRLIPFQSTRLTSGKAESHSHPMISGTCPSPRDWELGTGGWKPVHCLTYPILSRLIISQFPMPGLRSVRCRQSVSTFQNSTCRSTSRIFVACD
jgi:hypothetical protein